MSITPSIDLPDCPNLDTHSKTDVNEIDPQKINSIDFGSACIEELDQGEPLLVNSVNDIWSDCVEDPIQDAGLHKDNATGTDCAEGPTQDAGIAVGSDCVEIPKQDEDNVDDANLNESAKMALTDIAETIKKQGFTTKVKETIEEDINAWKNCTIKIAMVGGSGSGKSSFINAMIGLDPAQEHAAKVGITETTKCKQRFPHPAYPNFEFWDLPGVGTPNFKKDDYLETIEVEKYDFFIVASQGRFSENDAWLAKVVAKDKGFYFVRTMIDIDLSKDKMATRHLHCQAKVLDDIRSENITHLKNEGVLEPHVFLVNNYEPGKYDFNRIFSQLKNDAPQSKKEALVLCFTAMSPEIIDEKFKVLNARIYKVALLSSLAAAIPVPGTGSAVDVALLKRETAFYRKQLGTDDESLENIAKHLNMRLDELKMEVDLRSSIIFKNRLSILSFCSAFVIFEMIDNASLILIPAIGSLISMVTSYPSSVMIQKRLLKLCADEAYRVVKLKPSYIP